MTDLLYAGDNNPGGSYLIRFVPVAGIASMPAPAASGPSTPATFKTGFRWFLLYGTEGSKSFDQQEDETDPGQLWSVTVSAFLPADSDLIQKQLAIMSRHRFVLEVEDNAGLIRRIGTIVENFQLTYSFKTGGNMSERRGYQIQFKGVLTAPAPILRY